MAVKEQDVELIVRQILDQMSGSTAGAAPAAKASGTRNSFYRTCSYAY